MKKILSARIDKEYWLSNTEVEEFEKDGIPIYCPSDIAEFKTIAPSNEELLKIWILKAFQKIGVLNALDKIRGEKKEEHLDQFVKPESKLGPTAQIALKEIYKTLGRPNQEKEIRE